MRPRRHSLIASALLIAVVLRPQAQAPLAQPPRELRVGFRYDDSRVLFYTDTRQDPAKQDYSHPLPAPRARYGAGGYLLPLTPDRLATFRSPAPGSVPPIGSAVTVMLGDAREVTAVVDAYVEQWGSENPVVRIGVLAHVPSAQLQALRATTSDYFLVSMRTAAGAIPRSPTYMPSTQPQIVNRFGPLGDLVVHRAEAGWCVDLAVPPDGVRLAFAIPYCYGD